MVYGLCRLLLRDPHDAEDASQQVFLSAHRSMLSGTEPRDPGAWLGTIARNECASRIRERMATPLVLVDESAPAAGEVEHLAAQRAEVEALCTALAELPQQQRQAVVLREFYGLSYEEVRDALGVTASAVESLLFRARKRLQEELQPARAASGALAIPFALRDALASAVPGFSSGSGAGMLAKLASLPFAAKLIAAAATMSAAGTIGYAELGARDHVPARASRSAAHASTHHSSKAPVPLARALPQRSGHLEGSREPSGEVRSGGDGEHSETSGKDVVSRSDGGDDGLGGSSGSDSAVSSSDGSGVSGSGSSDSGDSGSASSASGESGDSRSGSGGDD